MIKKYQLYSALIPLLAIASISCGPEGSINQPQEAPVTAPIIKNASVVCAANAECSPSAAMLVVKTETGTGTCTGFLTNDGFLATNDHCIPHALHSGASCNNKIEVYFPAVGIYPAERVQCDKVFWRSADSIDKNPLSIDTVFLKLSKAVSRPILKFSHAGVEHHEFVKVFKVNPSSSSYSLALGVLETKTCRVVHKSTLYPSLDGRSSLGFVLTGTKNLDDCEIVSGNSGSAVVGADGEVRGIVHHSNRAGDSAAILNLFLLKFFGEKGPIIKNSFAVATNFSCVKSPDENIFVAPVECANSLSGAYAEEKRKEIKEANTKKNMETLNNLASAWGIENFPMFNWEMKVIIVGNFFQKEVFIPVPVCTRTNGLEGDNYKGRFLGWGYRNEYIGQNIEWPQYSVEFAEVDEDFNLKPTFKRVDILKPIEIGFSPSAIISGKSSHITLKEQGLVGKTYLVRDTLRTCK